MADLSLPLFDIETSYLMRLDLDDTEFQFLIRYNDRDGFWYLSIFDVDQNSLREGIKLVTGEYVNRFMVRTEDPDGRIGFTDITGEEREASLDDLVPDGDWEILYREAS